MSNDSDSALSRYESQLRTLETRVNSLETSLRLQDARFERHADDIKKLRTDVQGMVNRLDREMKEVSGQVSANLTRFNTELQSSTLETYDRLQAGIAGVAKELQEHVREEHRERVTQLRAQAAQTILVLLTLASVLVPYALDLLRTSGE